jgi:hypothetical protein
MIINKAKQKGKKNFMRKLLSPAPKLLILSINTASSNDNKKEKPNGNIGIKIIPIKPRFLQNR